MPQDLEDLARQALDWIKRQPSGAGAELYLSRVEERGIERREGRLDGVQQSSSEGAGLRLFDGGRVGFASAGGLGLEAIQDLYARVAAQMRYLEADEHRRLPQTLPSAEGAKLAESLWDDGLFSESLERIVPRLEEMERVVLAYDNRIRAVLRAGYGESRGEVVIASASGTLTRERGGSASVGLSVLGEQGAETQVGSAFQSERRRARLDFNKAAREAAYRTVALLGSQKPPGGKRDVIFDPWVAGEFLELIAGLLCADQVQRGKSLLAGRLGRPVASPLVTFVDDPRIEEGIASSLFDDEGLPTARKVMIDKGVVKDFFYDSYTAARDGRLSNASAGRGSYKGMPGPGSSNFFLEPGSASRESIIAGTKDGILMLEVMGMHMADPISGEFSVGVSGLSIRDGKIGGPVKNAMVSGNLLELLGGVDAVGGDLTFYGSMGAPTFRVAGLSVA